ncbi:GNAT family N-acetyltransferase [Vibrio natriegens]|uniref:GNAT family N-acetyltransferase n=1 Tax=Vibrio natriegens TaxID=691 RepID=UPI001592F2E5|nr:GNAT family N-acetyltransferase [Vibrio natriegens]NVC95376.1 GNAT family N-acetyltransferase [Vibrio natriegens]
MNISFRPTADFSKSAAITYDNMRSYYEHYSVDWDQRQILEHIVNLESWDILFDGEVVGAIRLEYDDGHCYLRDLQVSPLFQNKGIGAAALAETSRLAIKSRAQRVRLKVFKISPAYPLYQRSSFIVEKEDERFYYMSLLIA